MYFHDESQEHYIGSKVLRIALYFHLSFICGRNKSR